MAKGIKDKVVILGMGCSKFGERWDREADNLMVEAFSEAVADERPFLELSDADWLALLDVNLLGPVRLSRAVQKKDPE